MDALISLIPPFVAVGLALSTRRVMLSLFISIYIGGWLVAGDPVAAVGQTFDWFAELMKDDWNARFLVMIALLGSGAAFMHRNGGSEALINWLAARVKGRRNVQLLTWLLGVIIFIDDYVNTIIVGNTFRGLTAGYRVSREKLAYLLDSTSAPMSSLGPISSWIGYQVSLIAAAFVSLDLQSENAFLAFVHSIPWNFYAIMALLAVPSIIFLGDFGAMKQAERRARETGELVAPGDTPLSDIERELDQSDTQRGTIWGFMIPLIVLIAVACWALWYLGGGSEGKGLTRALADTEVSEALTWAGFAMTAVGVVFSLIQRHTLSDIENTLLSGFQAMLPALVIILMAWALNTITEELDTGEHIIEVTREWLSPALLPLLVFLVSILISFSTGSAWGTMAILTPIAIPLAYQAGDMSLVHMGIGAIFSGSIVGDHCSPISDTTVMSSTFAGSDHVAHVRTQIPYAVVPAAISALMYLASPLIDSVLLLLLTGLVVQTGTIYILARRARRVAPSSDGGP